jgi:hypothetical protein
MKILTMKLVTGEEILGEIEILDKETNDILTLIRELI